MAGKDYLFKDNREVKLYGSTRNYISSFYIFNTTLPVDYYFYFNPDIPLYCLTKSYRDEFYFHLNKQIKSQLRISDPFVYQFKGNIKNLNEPAQPVLGVFEVASLYLKRLVVYPSSGNNKVRFKKLNSFDVKKVPSAKYNIKSFPDFWIN
jgi:hypothetical protein